MSSLVGHHPDDHAIGLCGALLVGVLYMKVDLRSSANS